MTFLDRLKAVDIVVGVTLAVISFVLGGISYWLAAPQRALDAYNFQPRLDVRYYGIPSASPVGRHIAQASTEPSGLTHNLLDARRIVLPSSIDLPFEDVGPDTVVAFPDMQRFGTNFGCNLHVAYFKLHSAYPIESVRLNLSVVRREQLVTEPIAFLIGARDDGEAVEIELGQINDGEGFFVPVALECYNSRFPPTIYPVSTHPISLQFYDPINDSTSEILFREMLPSPTVDSTYIQVRG